MSDACLETVEKYSKDKPTYGADTDIINGCHKISEALSGNTLGFTQKFDSLNQQMTDLSNKALPDAHKQPTVEPTLTQDDTARNSNTPSPMR